MQDPVSPKMFRAPPPRRDAAGVAAQRKAEDRGNV